MRLAAPIAVSLAIGAALGGCSSTPTSGGDSGGVDMTASAQSDLALGAYPAGPYGRMIGNTFPPLAWEGYVAGAGDVVVSTRPYGPYSIDDARRSGHRYGIVHVSDYF